MERKIKIALAEDGRLNRQSFLRKIPAMPKCELVFIAKHGHECLEQLNGLPHSLLPDVLFMDIEMPLMNGIEAIARAKLLYPSIHFIVLTVFDDDDKIFAAIRAGAEGYLLKHENAETLQEAAINVMDFGGAPMSPAIARKALTLLRQSENERSASISKIPQEISTREKEVLQLMISGLDAKGIATNLQISVFTVHKHIANVYEKLHINSKAQFMVLAHHNGWF
ncbi:MAG: response regulator transcription factor [Bacteroidetes bacterium]|nr:response regulator transcription factor [Bacteroidota bacterium]